MLEPIHVGHFEIQSCLRHAKELLYWPNMNKTIMDLISRRESCQSSQKNPPKELVIQHQPDRPWQVTSDIFYFKNNQYILVVDSYSGFYQFEKLNKVI